MLRLFDSSVSVSRARRGANRVSANSPVKFGIETMLGIAFEWAVSLFFDVVISVVIERLKSWNRKRVV